MKLLVSYDIADDRRRNRISQILLDYGQRVQESVYWIEAEGALVGRMRERLRETVDSETDSVWILFLCEACIGKLEILGLQNLPEIPAYYIV